VSPVAAGILCALAASAAWAGANVFIQRAGRELGSLRSMLWAQILGVLMLLPVSLVLEGLPTALPLVPLLVTGAASALGYYGMLRAFRIGPLSLVTPIVASWPLSAVVTGIVWRGERPSALELAGGALVVGGSALNGWLAGDDAATGGSGEGRRAAILWGIGGSVGFGVMTAGVAELGPAVGVIGVVPVTWMVQWLLLTPVLVAQPDVRVPPPRWANVAGMAACEAAGFVAYSMATARAPVSLVSPPASLSTLCTVAFAAAFLGERIGLARWLSVLVGLGGTVLLAQ
jgi:drug/metabolite transporter (DMT)-like permease